MQSLRKIINYVLVAFFILGTACSSDNHSGSTKTKEFVNSKNFKQESSKIIQGSALGTSFMLKTSDDSLKISTSEIEAFFDEFNYELSTYIPNSLISRFNQGDTTLDLTNTKYFKTCFEQSQFIYTITEGSFDPTVFPLVKLWGFIKKMDTLPTQEEIDSVMVFTGFEENKLYTYNEGILKKKDARMELVFNAIAKGQAVDELAKILELKGQEKYYLEIGGEMRFKGLNERDGKWVIGIDLPSLANTGLQGDELRSVENYIEITDKSLATSGNYRDFYEYNNEIYGHTISPTLGKPIKTDILSATVIADEVAIADGLATAFMVMRVEKAMAVLTNLEEDLKIDAYFLYEKENGRIGRAYNKGMLKYLMEK